MVTLEDVEAQVTALDMQIDQIIKANGEDAKDTRMFLETMGNAPTKNGTQTMRLDGLMPVIEKLQADVANMGGTDSGRLQVVTKLLKELTPIVNRVNTKVAGFEKRLKTVEHGRPGGLKGKLPVFTEREKTLGIWSVSGHRILDDWVRKPSGRPVHIEFEPIDIPWQGETLIAYRVLQAGRIANKSAARLHKRIQHESLNKQPLSFGIEVFKVDNFPDRALSTWPDMNVFAAPPRNRGTVGSRPNAPLQFTEIEAFTDWDGNEMFVSRATAVIRDVKCDPKRGALLDVGFKLVAGITNGGVLPWPAWTAVRPVAL